LKTKKFEILENKNVMGNKSLVVAA